jgi:hypothetical protein
MRQGAAGLSGGTNRGVKVDRHGFSGPSEGLMSAGTLTLTLTLTLTEE